MKALFKAEPGAGLELVDRPDPVAGADEVVIRVLRTGICGTDLHIHRWDDWAASAIQTPLIPGHEFYGEVVEVGPLVQDIAIGDRVSGEGHIVCGTCRNCRAGRRQMCIRTIGLGLQRDGAFAEYLSLPAANVWVHHPDVSPELGAIFDPLGNAVHTALAFPLVGEDVLVTGCGPIGLMAIAVARHAGARFITATDVSAPRLEMARQMGADEVVDVSVRDIREAQVALGMREGFDRVLDEAVAGAVALTGSSRLIVTEGNYLLHDRDGWERILPLLDEVWYLDVPEDLRMSRLVARHESFGRSHDDAVRWATDVDGPNAALIHATRHRAGVLITLTEGDDA